ncbi:endonuclease-reverse transcriptase-domain-containing protein, partial [Dichotomocladium elegans]
MPDDEALDVLHSLPINPNPNQTNTIFCGDFNARHAQLLGDSKSTQRGYALAHWITETGLCCWNAEHTYGQPTYYCCRRTTSDGGIFQSIIDLMLSTNNLLQPHLTVRSDLSLGSDHHPITLTFHNPLRPPPKQKHPRRLWNLGKLLKPNCFYVQLFAERTTSLRSQLRHL